MSTETHIGRMAVGVAWSMMGLMMSIGYSKNGYGEIEAIGLGLLTVPLVIIAFYVIGTIGHTILDYAGILERI